MAEKEGKPVELLVVPAVNPFDALAQARQQPARFAPGDGVSARMASEELARRIGLAWERLPEPRHPFSLEVISPDRPSTYVNLGPHPPRLWPEDVDLLHEIWLKLSEWTELGSRLHHRDVVGYGAAEAGARLEWRAPDEHKVTTCSANTVRPHPDAPPAQGSLNGEGAAVNSETS